MSAEYRLTQSGGYIRASDRAAIPKDPRNADYQTVQAWIATGNIPDPYVAASLAEELRLGVFQSDADRAQWLLQLQAATPDQIATFVRNSINSAAIVDLASAKSCIVRLETAVVILAKLVALDPRR